MADDESMNAVLQGKITRGIFRVLCGTYHGTAWQAPEGPQADLHKELHIGFKGGGQVILLVFHKFTILILPDSNFETTLKVAYERT